MVGFLADGYGLRGELERAPAGDQLDNQDNHGGEEDEVDEIPDGIDVDESQESENQQHNKDSPEHMFFVGLVYFASFPGRRLRLNIFENPARFGGRERRFGAAK